jgi:hypothetical protein
MPSFAKVVSPRRFKNHVCDLFVAKLIYAATLTADRYEKRRTEAGMKSSDVIELFANWAGWEDFPVYTDGRLRSR